MTSEGKYSRQGADAYSDLISASIALVCSMNWGCRSCGLSRMDLVSDWQLAELAVVLKMVLVLILPPAAAHILEVLQSVHAVLLRRPSPHPQSSDIGRLFLILMNRRP